ncbi:ribosome maturation factor RimP [Marinimicrobium sp. ARAG 43.8]|uniref:ribosome maturation factor RimP n=1 Tax=Marinimicrobium sp. ARAG 43.8 TaxID=3418719 RepID=UPI003CF4FDEF
MASKEEQLYALIAPVVDALECELWGMEYLTQGRYSTLRLYIDRSAENGGVTLEDCERVSRQVSSVMDVEDPITNRYTLEVSSPGLDRPLFTPEQYQRYIGEVIALKTRAPVAGRRKFKGQLRAIEGDSVVLIVDGSEHTLSFGSIEKANVVPRF